MMSAGSEVGSVGPVREALAVCAASRMSGALRLTGNPGGTIYLNAGLVVGIETPGAPGPEVLLLRSHRLTESRWDAAFAAAAAAGRQMSAELVAREVIGAGELEVLLRTALADAMFVLAAGVLDEYRAEQGAVDWMLPLEPGVEPDWLLAEATRRIEVVASLPLPTGHGSERIAAAPSASRQHTRLGGGRDEILTLADGRRTPRDIAFARGGGVYATMLQMARMYEAGLLVTVSRQAASAAAARKPDHPASPNESPRADRPPRRGKGSPGLPQRTAPSGRVPEPRGSLGLLRPRSSPGADPSHTP